MESVYRPGEPFRIGILIYPIVEELDFVGPLEVLNTAAEVEAQERGADETTWQVFTVAETSAPVEASNGMVVQPKYSFDNHPPIDLLLIPGGHAGAQAENPVVQAWLSKVLPRARVISSVCTGAFLLAKQGVLDGHRATTHWASLKRLQEAYPNIAVQHDTRWVDEWPIVTAAGVSAGIDMSLHLVERLLGRPMAEKVAHYIEYAWNDHGV